MAAVQVGGHATQLTRAVGNLTDNAARHAISTVTLSLAERGPAAVLAVSDDGPGIPAEDRERMFERFTRLDDARTARTGGAGLGLAIARDIVERHGGTLHLDPGHHPGARLVVTLPLGPGEVQPRGPVTGTASRQPHPDAFGFHQAEPDATVVVSSAVGRVRWRFGHRYPHS